MIPFSIIHFFFGKMRTRSKVPILKSRELAKDKIFDLKGSQKWSPHFCRVLTLMYFASWSGIFLILWHWAIVDFESIHWGQLGLDHHDAYEGLARTPSCNLDFLLIFRAKTHCFKTFKRVLLWWAKRATLISTQSAQPRYAQNYQIPSSIILKSNETFQVIFKHCARTANQTENFCFENFVPGHAKLSIIIIADRSISLSSLFDFLSVRSKSRPLKRVSISFLI